VQEYAEVEGAFEAATRRGATIQFLGGGQGSFLFQDACKARGSLSTSTLVGAAKCRFRRVDIAAFLRA
jgi:hypothetical protein